jgi:hypothetical protein
MASDRLTSLPVAFTAGTNLRIDLSFDEHLASAGGTLAVYFRGPGTIADSDFVISTDDDAFTIDVTAAATTLWPIGTYQYTVKHTDTDTIAEVVLSGKIDILPDPVNQTNIEARTVNEIMVARIETLIQELALNPYKQIMISDKQYSLQNLPELQELLDEYKSKVFEESQAESNRQGNYKQYDVSFQFTD